jgi:hypothetical protein
MRQAGKGRKRTAVLKYCCSIWPPAIVDRSVPAPSLHRLCPLHGLCRTVKFFESTVFPRFVRAIFRAPLPLPFARVLSCCCFLGVSSGVDNRWSDPWKGNSTRADDTGPPLWPRITKPAWTPPKPAFDGHRIRQSHAQQRAPRTLHCSRPCPARSMEACGLPP